MAAIDAGTPVKNKFFTLQFFFRWKKSCVTTTNDFSLLAKKMMSIVYRFCSVFRNCELPFSRSVRISFRVSGSARKKNPLPFNSSTCQCVSYHRMQTCTPLYVLEFVVENVTARCSNFAPRRVCKEKENYTNMFLVFFSAPWK